MPSSDISPEEPSPKSDEKSTLSDLQDNELARSKELLDITGELAKIGGWQVDLVTMKLSWTLQTFRIAELEPPNEPPLEEGINLFAPEARPVIAAAVQAAIDDGTPYDLVLPLITAKGRHIWVQTQGYAEMYKGKSVRLFGTFQDITERKLAEDRLRAYEKENSDLRKALDEHAIVAITDEYGRITYVNEKFCAISKYSREELLGQDHRMINSGEHSKEFFRDLWATIQSGSPWHGEICNKDKEGMQYWVDTTIIPFKSESGEIRQYVAIRKDITDRKRAERALMESEFRWKFAIEGSGDGLWDWNVESGAVFFSKRWKETLGYSESEIGNNFDEWRERVHPDDLDGAMEAVRRHLDGETLHYENEHRLRCKDGSWKWILARGVVLERDEKGNPLRVIGTHTDASERKQAESALRTVEEQLRQAQKLKAIGTLAGGIAHDFNNILSGIYGFAALAKDAAEGNEDVLDYVEEIRAAGRRAAKLVREILTFSRTETEPVEPVQLNQIVREAVGLLEATLPSEISLEFDLPEGLPAVLGNSTQLHQIVMNLGTNAVQAMGDSFGRLTVQLRSCVLEPGAGPEFTQCAPGEYLCLAISDTGPGMDPETKARVFEPFFTTKAPGEGSGLGLSVVHGIVLNHNGAIRLVSERGEGTSIEIYLPVIAKTLAEAEIQVGGELHGNGEVVLFVDDDAPVARAGVIALSKLGYVVEGANNALDALARVERDPNYFDIVIADQTMPKLTGLELAARIHSLRADLPVVIASGYSSALTEEKIEAAGVKEVIAKPYLPSDLVEAIHRWLAPEGD